MTQVPAFSTGQVAALLDIARANINANLHKGQTLDQARLSAEYDLTLVMGIGRNADHTPQQSTDALHKRVALRRILAEIGS